jgi:hypothetical protein
MREDFRMPTSRESPELEIGPDMDIDMDNDY